MQQILRLCFSVAVLVAVLVAGCDSEPASLNPVRGKVTYHGSPLYTGTIVFTPDESRGTTASLARAEIRQDGTYDLWSLDVRGAKAGWYRVTIMAVEGSAGGGVPRSLVPDKYRDPELSGLACVIKPDQENVVDFNLE